MKKKLEDITVRLQMQLKCLKYVKKKHIFLKMCNDFDLKICILKIEADIASLGSGQRNMW